MKSLFFFLCCIFLLPACNTNNKTTVDTLRVTVLDDEGKGIANVVVVIGSLSGAMVSSASTDTSGTAVFNAPPPNAVVTAASSCTPPASTRTYYDIDTVYEVNVPALTLTVGSCKQNDDYINVNVVDAPGVARSEITVGPITYSGPTHTMEAASSVQDDGKVSVFVAGYDEAGAIKGFGLAMDQAVNNTIDVAIDRTGLVQHAHALNNVPSTAVSYFAYASLLRKHAMTNLPFNFAFDMAPPPATITTYSAEGFSDTVNYGAGVSLDRDSDGAPDADLGLVRYLSGASDQVFDFSAAPVVPAGLTYDPGAAGRATISWSNNDPLATAQALVLSYSTTTPKASYYYAMTVPASATSIVFPELPEVLAVFRPSAYKELSLQAIKFETPKTYKEYLDAAASHKGRFYEAAGMNSYSSSRISRVP